MNELVTTQGQQLVSQTPAMIAAAECAKMQIVAAYQMAINCPRSFDGGRIRILEHCKRKIFADKCIYTLPFGATKARGLTIKFAEMAIREWHNIITSSAIIYEDESTRQISVTVTDVESNCSHTRQVIIEKTVERKSSKGRQVLGTRTNSYGEEVFLVVATESELLAKQNSLVSKAIRNEAIRLIPADIIEEAEEMLKKTIESDVAQDPDKERKKIIDAFVVMGVSPEMLAAYLKHDTKNIAVSEIVELRGIYTAIKSGEATWANFMRLDIEEKTNSAVSGLEARLAEAKPKPKEEIFPKESK